MRFEQAAQSRTIAMLEKFIAEPCREEQGMPAALTVNGDGDAPADLVECADQLCYQLCGEPRLIAEDDQHRTTGFRQCPQSAANGTQHAPIAFSDAVPGEVNARGPSAGRAIAAAALAAPRLRDRGGAPTVMSSPAPSTCTKPRRRKPKL
jgi:hypothetical protein